MFALIRIASAALDSRQIQTRLDVLSSELKKIALRIFEMNGVTFLNRFNHITDLLLCRFLSQLCSWLGSQHVQVFQHATALFVANARSMYIMI